jgi:hypothetical protein
MWYDAFAFQGPCGDMDWDEEFVAPPMYEQLGKVVDSIGNPKPIKWVTTDDGYQIRVTGREAQLIIKSIQHVPVKKRVDYLRKIQQSPGLIEAIEIIRSYES